MMPDDPAGSGAVSRSTGPLNGPCGELAVYATTCELNTVLLSTVTRTHWLPTFCAPWAVPAPDSPIRADVATPVDQPVPFQYSHVPPRPPAGTLARRAK